MPDLKGLFLKDEVFAYPTEGVWGLGCNPFSEKAVQKLINLKKRPKNKELLFWQALFSNCCHLLNT